MPDAMFSRMLPQALFQCSRGTNDSAQFIGRHWPMNCALLHGLIVEISAVGKKDPWKAHSDKYRRLHLGIAKVADLQKRAAAAAPIIGEQQVFKLEVSIGNSLQSAQKSLTDASSAKGSGCAINKIYEVLRFAERAQTIPPQEQRGA